jgi:hypothetical protein
MLLIFLSVLLPAVSCGRGQMGNPGLDETVTAAYGWPSDLTDEEVLSRLFTLNLERAAE